MMLHIDGKLLVSWKIIYEVISIGIFVVAIGKLMIFGKKFRGLTETFLRLSWANKIQAKKCS